MDRPKCRLCDEEHWSYEPHVFATNERLTEATNTKAATNSSATNKQLATNRGEFPDAALHARTPNRRSREAYNAYQREYMRKRRAISKLAVTRA